MPRTALIAIVGLAALTTGACRAHAPAPQLSPDPQLNAFVLQLERDLEAHAWENILAVADPDHFRAQVTEHGMPEPQYLAELFGLHRVDNDIGRGERITRADLERITEVDLHELARENGRHTLTGQVRLTGGRTLQLRAWIVEQEGRYRLTGALG